VDQCRPLTAAAALPSSAASELNQCVSVYAVYIAVTSDAGSNDILYHLIDASDLADQVKLMRLVSIVLNVSFFGWQVTLCDLIWHVISRSGVVISITNCYIRFTLLTYFFVKRESEEGVLGGPWDKLLRM